MADSFTKKNTFLNFVIIVFIFIILLIGVNIYFKLSAKEDNTLSSGYNNSTGKIIQVEVLNGTSEKGIASGFVEFLRKNKLDVVRFGNYKNSNVEESFIIDRLGNQSASVTVTKILGISPNKIKQDVNPDSIVDVSIIIGKDYKKLKGN